MNRKRRKHTRAEKAAAWDALVEVMGVGIAEPSRIVRAFHADGLTNPTMQYNIVAGNCHSTGTTLADAVHGAAGVLRRRGK